MLLTQTFSIQINDRISIDQFLEYLVEKFPDQICVLKKSNIIEIIFDRTIEDLKIDKNCNLFLQKMLNIEKK